MNAVDTALVLLGGASNALERHQPALPDVEEARDKAKAAHEVLDASAKLLKRLIYSVTDEPKADTPLFTGDGQPAPGTHTSPEPAEPGPKVVPMALGCSTVSGPVIDVEIEAPHALDGLGDDEQITLFNQSLDQLEELGVEAGLRRKAWKAAEDAWCNAWEANRHDTYTRLEIALEQRPMSWAVPDDEAVFEYQRKQALATPNPDFDQAAGE